MTSSHDLLQIVRETFESLVAADDQSLSKAELAELLRTDEYEIVRGALLATDKVDAIPGRGGGLTFRRTQGNRREWGAAAETKAQRFLSEHANQQEEEVVGLLEEIYAEWPQSRIAEVLGVSQPTISNWLRTRSIPEKHAAAVRKLQAELTGPSSDPEQKRSVATRDEPAPLSQYGEWLRAELERRQTNAVELAARTGIGINTIVALLEGRTERPQQRTRERIEKALAVTAPEDGAPAPIRPTEEDTWYYIGLPWTREEIDQVPDEPGVYIIHDRLGRPAYVGVAHKGAGGIRARLKKHDELRWTSDRRVASTFSYALAARMPSSDPSSLAKALEKLLIKFMGNAILINEKGVEDLAD